MKKIVFGLVIYLASITAWAQNSLSGKVLDAKTGAVLAGASVWAVQSGRGTVADENGAFQLSLIHISEPTRPY